MKLRALLLALLAVVISAGPVAAGGPDQAQEIRDGSGTAIGGDYVMGQVFVATKAGGLHLLDLRITRQRHGGDTPLVVSLGTGSWGTLTILGTTTVTEVPIAMNRGKWVRVRFDPPIQVQPGTYYFIRASSSEISYLWFGAFGDPYPAGLAIEQIGDSTTGHANWDFAFRTYVR